MVIMLVLFGSFVGHGLARLFNPGISALLGIMFFPSSLVAALCILFSMWGVNLTINGKGKNGRTAK